MSVRHVLLALPSQGAKYGEQLRQEYEQTSGGLWPLNAGQVYTTLQRLKRDGLIEPDANANQRRAKSLPHHRGR
jgi:DNA-binding PadR family transcriptional regulator